MKKNKWILWVGIKELFNLFGKKTGRASLKKKKKVLYHNRRMNKDQKWIYNSKIVLDVIINCSDWWFTHSYLYFTAYTNYLNGSNVMSKGLDTIYTICRKSHMYWVINTGKA